MIRFKKRFNWLASAGLLLALLLAVSLTITPAMADPPAPPGFPHQFYGTVSVNGGPATAGTAVAAYVNGTLNASTTVDSLGRYGYSPIFTVTGTDGQTVTFKVGTADASQSATYQSGGITRLDLTVVTTTLAVSTSAASSIGSSTATLNGNLTNIGGFSSVTVKFEYGTTTSYGTSTATQSKTATGTFTADISGLTPSTLYHCRAVATSGSITVYGVDMSFTTTASALSVSTNAATSVTATGATLNGNLTDLGANSSVQVYFQYGTTSSYGSTTTAQTKTATGTFTAALTGLLSNTTYHFRAVAVGSTTVYGSDMTWATSVGTLAVTTGSATSISASSATLNGTLTGLGTNSSVSVYFKYGTTTSYGSTTPTQTMTSPGAFSAGISGLTPSTTYHFQAVAIGSTTVSGSDASFATSASTGGMSPPHQFYGYVYVSGTLAPSGTAVAAYVSGSPAASTTTNSSGKYGYTTLFLVPGTSGGTVTFYVGGTLVPQTATWSSGGMTRLNLYSTGPGALSVSTGSASYVSTTSANFGGTLVSLGTDTSASVSIEYGTTTSYGSSTTAQTMSSTGTFTHTATGLTSGTTYHYRAKAVGSTTVYGSDATYVHTPGGTLAVVTSGATVGTTTATLNGSLTGMGTDTSATLSFEWGATTSYGSTAAGVPPTLTGTGTFTASLTGLTSGTTYHCRAKAVGSPSSTTVYGSDVTFVPSTTTTLIGSSTAGSIMQSENNFILNKFTATATGTVTQIKVYALVSYGKVKVAIYADNSGEPGALLNANNTGQAVTANVWNTLSITGTNIVSGTAYWLAINMDYIGGTSCWTSTGVPRRYKTTTYKGFTFPDPAGSGFTSDSYEMSIAGD